MSRPENPGCRRISLAGVRLELDDPPERLPQVAAERLGIPLHQIREWVILRRSLDARGRRKPRFEVRLGLVLAPEAAPHELPGVGAWPTPSGPPSPLPRPPGARPLVVGAGPAGLFAALRLRAYGIPALLLEQGEPIAARVRRVARYWRDGVLDESSNVQFGEGGAGTFSDGKLTYRGKDPRKQWVFEQLVALGAPPEILFEARPHLGTDRLRGILTRLRAGLSAFGTEMRFGTRVERLTLDHDAVVGVSTPGGEIRGAPVFLAPGHSSRRLVAAVVGQGVSAQAKGFALGVRIQVPQEGVDLCQYGTWNGHPALPPAEFAVKARGGEREVYSFCMCPGGVVIPAGSESGGLVVNGMSGSRRSSRWANAALVVTVEPADFRHQPLAGHALQRHWEEAAHRSVRPAHVPAQRVGDFLRGREGSRLPASNCPWPLQAADLGRCLPEFAAAALREALPRLQRQLPVLADGVLIGVETRTSSPVRLLRDANGRSESVHGLYPIGEGAGYAGGIVSSAVDAVRAVDAWIATLGRAPGDVGNRRGERGA